MEKHNQQQQQIPNSVILLPFNTNYTWWIKWITNNGLIPIPWYYIKLEHTFNQHDNLLKHKKKQQIQINIKNQLKNKMSTCV